MGQHLIGTISPPGWEPICGAEIEEASGNKIATIERQMQLGSSFACEIKQLRADSTPMDTPRRHQIWRMTDKLLEENTWFSELLTLLQLPIEEQHA